MHTWCQTRLREGTSEVNWQPGDREQLGVVAFSHAVQHSYVAVLGIVYPFAWPARPRSTMARSRRDGGHGRGSVATDARTGFELRVEAAPPDHARETLRGARDTPGFLVTFHVVRLSPLPAQEPETCGSEAAVFTKVRDWAQGVRLRAGA